jgi:hypothetical protein
MSARPIFVTCCDLVSCLGNSLTESNLCHCELVRSLDRAISEILKSGNSESIQVVGPEPRPTNDVRACRRSFAHPTEQIRKDLSRSGRPARHSCTMMVWRGRASSGRYRDHYLLKLFARHGTCAIPTNFTQPRRAFSRVGMSSALCPVLWIPLMDGIPGSGHPNTFLVTGPASDSCVRIRRVVRHTL